MDIKLNTFKSELNHKPMVSICCQTFNHKNYIEQTLNSFLMQKTNFTFEILLRDDASTDGTAEICKEYKNKHPDVINLLAYEENQWQKGVRPFLDNVKRAQGKYIALCEGDDYWTDPYKLQKQVDFLEANEDYAIHSGVAIVIRDNKLGNEFLGNYGCDKTFTAENFYIQNNLITCTVMFKNIIKDYSDWPKIAYGDWFLYTYLLNKSKLKAYVAGNLFSAYRIHDGGVFSSSTPIDYHRNHIIQIITIKKHVKDNKRSIDIENKISEHCLELFNIYLNKKEYFKSLHVLFYNIYLCKLRVNIKTYWLCAKLYFGIKTNPFLLL